MRGQAHTPLDDVALLARSQHRVDVLTELAAGSATRRELHDRTGISQPTLGRILGVFEERNWVRRDDGTYVLTAWGELVASAFEDLLSTVETVQSLADIADLLPTEAFDFGVRRLAGATVTRPQPGDVFKHVHRVEAILRSATEIRLITDDILREALEDQHERLQADTDPAYRLETVVTDAALTQAFEDPTLVSWIQELLESDRTPVYRYDGSVPMTMAVADGTALLVVADTQGIPGAVLETDDEAVRGWVDRRFEQYRDAATELSIADIPDDCET